MQKRADSPKSVSAFRRDLRVLERAMLRQLESDTACCAISLAQCHALLELSFAELSLRALAEALDLDASTVSRTVDSLVKAGWVERAEDAADRRSVRLRITAAGRAKVAGIDRMCNRYYESLLGRLGEEDRQCVIRGVRLLAERMRAPGTAPSCSAMEED